MSKYMNINGQTFEVIKPRKYPVSLTNKYYLRGLSDCYEKPSVHKQAIYDEWYEWYRSDIRLSEFGITSYNTFMFTIGCIFTDEETGERGYIKITPAKQVIYMA